MLSLISNITCCRIISSIFLKIKELLTLENYLQAKEFVKVCMDNGVYDFDTAYM